MEDALREKQEADIRDHLPGVMDVMDVMDGMDMMGVMGVMGMIEVLKACVDMSEISPATTEQERSALQARPNHTREQVSGPSLIGRAQSSAQIESPMAPTTMSQMPGPANPVAALQNRAICPKESPNLKLNCPSFPECKRKFDSQALLQEHLNKDACICGRHFDGDLGRHVRRYQKRGSTSHNYILAA
ncbi:hypothetical protein NQ176_g9760 [Zarea fungicola]|uniref:Uncharacterized protein n=1 Tax=Zarea fungicola TaxID=93591 RepID=A0ACC1MLL6_9HYPO|nr:hypothetical protein NQ176_g9760 [Lecanicillium fungicola]